MRWILAILAVWALAGAGAGYGDVALDGPAHLDMLYTQLQEADPEDWQDIEAEIFQIESDSGSMAMDFLLQRGERALLAGEYPGAVAHFSALVEHAPKFAQGYSGRATGYFLQQEYGLAMADIRQTLILNPRHFGALTGLAMILEETGDPARALQAYRMVQAIHPYLDAVNAAVNRLRMAHEGMEL